jgi:hypothetical protein
MYPFTYASNNVTNKIYMHTLTKPYQIRLIGSSSEEVRISGLYFNSGKKAVNMSEAEEVGTEGLFLM